MTGGAGVGALGTGDRDAFETAEYIRSDGLAEIEASAIYAAGGTGADVTIGFVDTGIDRTQSEFAGRIDPNSINIVTGRNDDIGDLAGHGTAVAGIAAAARDGVGTHGVAFQSRLLVVRSDAAGSCPDSCLFNQGDLANATDHARLNGAAVINYSLGDANSLGNDLRRALTRAADSGIVSVFAAGNAGKGAPAWPAMFATEAAANGRALIVGAVEDDGDMASFSNRAGAARDFYLVAPGVNIETTGRGDTTVLASGTSMAAPFVSGAAAALIHAAPHLSAEQVVALLLATAEDLGAPGVDDVYGHGLLDLSAALAPVGPLSLPSGSRVADGGLSVSASSLEAGPAFGAASGLKAALGEVMALDAFDRGYSVDLGGAVARPDGRTRIDRWLRGSRSGTLRRDVDLGDEVGLTALAQSDEGTPAGMGVELALGRYTDIALSFGEGLPFRSSGNAADSLLEDASGLPFLGLVDGAALGIRHELSPGWRLGLALGGLGSDALEDGNEAHALGIDITHSWESGHSLKLTAGGLQEDDGILGATGSGALSLPGAVTGFAGLEARFELDERTSFEAMLGLGRTAAGKGDGLVGSVDAFWSTGFGMTLEHRDRFLAEDRLTLAVRQPLRAESGRMELDLPVARNIDGDIVRDRRKVDLSPTGRAIDLELGYSFALDDMSRLASGLAITLNPDHVRGAAPEAHVGLRYSRRF